MNAPLQLRDIHVPAEPSWWPPAPGWWLLAALLLLAAAWLLRRAWRARRERLRRAKLIAAFDDAAREPQPALRLAAVSALLRRAARQRAPHAAALQGEAWLRFLDGDPASGETAAGATRDSAFSRGPGRALLEAPFRPDTDAATADAVIAPARARYLELLDAA